MKRVTGWLLQARTVGAGSSLLAVLVALAIGAVLIAATGANPLTAYATMFEGAFGSTAGLASTLVESVPLILAGTGVALGFRAGVFNIGAEGQLYVGGLGAAAVGLGFPDLPAVLLLPLMALAGALAGSVWSLIPGLLRIRLGSSEVINTIMFNYIGIYLVGYFLHGPLQAEGATSFGETSALPQPALLPMLVPAGGLHAGYLLAVLAAVLFAALLARSTWGFRVRLAGDNPRAAAATGTSVARTLLWVFGLSGALAGLAGFCEVSGVQHRMIENLSPGYGYVAIVVALLGGNNPLGVIVAGTFMAALDVGALTMQSVAGVPSAVGECIQYLVVILVIARAAVQPMLMRRKVVVG